MGKTTIEWIRKVNDGGVEIHYVVEKESNSGTRFYNYFVVIPKDRLADLRKALNDKRF